jgi:predicted amidohydrolase
VAGLPACEPVCYSAWSETERRGEKMKVAIAQIEPVLGDLGANLAKHLEWVKRARSRQAELVVFPELSLTGYLLQDIVPEVAQMAGSSAILKSLRAAGHDLGIVVGFVEQSRGFRFFNAAAYLENGRIIHTHRKAYLPTYGMFDEGRYFAVGETFRSFPSRIGAMGILVCEDLWHTTSSFLLSQDGAEILVVPSNSPTKGVDKAETLASQTAWLELARVVARFQTVFLLYANRVGFEDGIHFGGGSFVVDPFGNVVARSDSWEEELIVTDLSIETLREARTTYPLLRDERLDLLYRELGRLRKRRFNL